MNEYRAGEDVVYLRRSVRNGAPAIDELPATFIRSQIVNGRTMHIIRVGRTPPRQVATYSIRRP